jgi:NAD(P)-dependent dehydrogenase (short-subunit alcohol dehydrogenase family)
MILLVEYNFHIVSIQESHMNKVLVIGATGLLGRAVVKALSGQAQVVEASKSHKENSVDISNPQSLADLFKRVGTVDSVICTAGMADFKDYSLIQDSDWEFGIHNKLMGQVNVVRYGAPYVNAGGSILLTTGVLSLYPVPGSSIITTVNAAVEAFVKSAALELAQKVRVNAVSPGWVQETLAALNMDVSQGLAASEIAQSYLQLVNSDVSGVIQIAAKV